MSENKSKEYSCLDRVGSCVGEIAHCPQDKEKEEEMILMFKKEWG